MPPLPPNGKGGFCKEKFGGKTGLFFAFAGAGEIVLGREICYTVIDRS